MGSVGVIILHAEAGPAAGPLEAWLAAARRTLADRQQRAFAAAGASEARVVAGIPDGRSFGELLRDLARPFAGGGLVVLGSGSIPLATAADRRALVAAAGVVDRRRAHEQPLLLGRRSRSPAPRSSPACPTCRRTTPCRAGSPRSRVTRSRSWPPAGSGFDVDDPLDLVLLRRARPSSPLRVPPGVDTSRAEAALGAVSAVARDASAELLVAGRASSASLAWLELRTAARVRALIEERGLRAASPAAASSAAARPRPPASVLGALLDRDGPEAFGSWVARLGDGALVDSRVLLAHRLGADERSWPAAEDRFASDLLLHERIADPWLRALTRSAHEAPVPIVLGGHTLVGPGIRLALR